MNFLFKNEIIDYEFFHSKNSSKSILFLHGWGGNKNSFTTTINLLKKENNILTLTMPTISETTSVWTIEDYTNLIIELLHLHNINSVTIICHSFGFRIACLLNQKLTINKIIVTGGAGPKKENFITKITKNNNKILLKKNKNKFLYSSIASKDYLSLSNQNKQTFKNVVNCNLKNFLVFNCPMLLFWGNKDTETKIWIAKLIKKKNNATLIKTKSDHFAYLKLNSLFNHYVLEFLGEK